MNANLIKFGITNSRSEIPTGSTLAQDDIGTGNFEQVFDEVKEVRTAKSASSNKSQKEKPKEIQSLASQKSKIEKTENTKETAKKHESGGNTADISADESDVVSENELAGGEKSLKREEQNKAMDEGEENGSLIISNVLLPDYPALDMGEALSPLNVSSNCCKNDKSAGLEGVLKEIQNPQVSLNGEEAAKIMEGASQPHPLSESKDISPLSVFTDDSTIDSQGRKAIFFKTGQSEVSHSLSGEISTEGLSGLETLSQIEGAQGSDSKNQIVQEFGKEKQDIPLFREEKKGENEMGGKNLLNLKPETDKISGAGKIQIGEKIEKAVEKSASTQNDFSISPNQEKSSAESLSMKSAIQSPGLEIPKEVKPTGNEKNNALPASKSSGIDANERFMEASAFQNAGEQGLNDKASALAWNKSLLNAGVSAELDAGKFDIQSLMSSENTSSGPNGSSGNVFNLSSIGMSETRPQDLSNIASLKDKHTVDGKPQEVFERAVLDQIVSKATYISKNGQNEMRIQLDPPSLGTVKVQVTVEGEKVSANVLADNSIARDIIERNIQHLRNSLSEQGLKVEHMSVNVGNDPKQQGAGHERFFMEKEFSQRDSRRGDGYGKSDPVEILAAKNNFKRDGGISIFI